MPSTATNAMTVDVEDWFQVAAFADRIRPDDWDACESRVEANTDRLLGMFSSRRVKATFFVLGWIAERQRGLVRRIDAEGHEVACHGFSHQLVYNQERTVFREETLRAKAVLEDITGRPVRGYRAASYSVTRASLWALDVLAEAGFEYDSSIFPVRHDRYGIPGGERWPHTIQSPGGAQLAEFPLTTVQWLGQRLPVAGGGYFRLYPYWLSRLGLAGVERQNRPIIFYLHPWELDPHQPRVGASPLSRFRHYTNLGRCQARLERLLEDFAWTRCDTVLEGLGLLPPAGQMAKARPVPRMRPGAAGATA